MNRTTKLVGYAYPTSNAAKRFGFYASGCHIVETMTCANGTLTTKILSGHATKAEALKVAESLPHEWNGMYLRYA